MESEAKRQEDDELGEDAYEMLAEDHENAVGNASLDSQQRDRG